MNKIEWLSESTVKLQVVAEEAELAEVKKQTIKTFQSSVTLPGFRKGKVPASKVESAVDESVFKNQFLDGALNFLFDKEVRANKLRPVGQPKVEIVKFVPFTTLEFNLEVEVVGKIKLGDYKKFKLSPDAVKVEKSETDAVISSLQKRMADKKEVKRAAKNGDEAWINFDGKDAKGKEVAGASGKDYPLLLGSNTFIPGFEPAIVGMEPGETKDFEVTFPADYSHKPLANQKVTFTVTLNKVQEVTEPEVTDKFAADAGPFKTVAELKQDIEKQLSEKKASEADANFKDKILEKLVESSEIPVPEVLLNDQAQVELDEFKQNLTYRGMTIQDYLEQAGKDEETFVAEEIKPVAERKVKVGLALSQVASDEKLTVSQEEVEIRIQLLKGQYKDPEMQAQLDMPQSQQEIASRLLTEKSIARLVEAISKSK